MVSPSGTGYVDDLYTIPFATEDKRHLLETRFMKQIDQRAHDALCKIETGNISSLTQTERAFWVTFLISLQQRNPQKVSELKEASYKILQGILERLRPAYPSRRTPDDPETFDEFLRHAEDTKYFEQMITLLLQDAIFFEDTTNLILNFYWGVLWFDEYNHRLLTSDRPVIIRSELMPFDGFIALPIGPRAVFLACGTRAITRTIRDQKNLVETINNAVVRQAQQYVYGTDNAQLDFVERRLQKPSR
jgi:Protein of unknown function (DUF4238)